MGMLDKLEKEAGVIDLRQKRDVKVMPEPVSDPRKPLDATPQIPQKEDTISGQRALELGAGTGASAGLLPVITREIAEHEAEGGGVQFGPEVQKYLDDPSIPQQDKDELLQMIAISKPELVGYRAGESMRKEMQTAAGEHPMKFGAGNLAGSIALGTLGGAGIASLPVSAGAKVGLGVAADMAQGASEGYGMTKDPKSAAISALGSGVMSGGQRALAGPIAKKLVPPLKDFYFGTPAGEANIPFTKGRRLGLPEGSKESGPVEAEMGRLAGPESENIALKTRPGFIKKTLEPEMQQSRIALDEAQFKAELDAVMAKVPQPNRLRFADRLETIAEDMLLSGDPKYTSVGNDLKFYTRNVLDPVHSSGLRPNLSRQDTRGIVSSVDDQSWHMDAAGKQRKISTEAQDIIRAEAKRLYHESLTPEGALAEQAARDRFSTQDTILHNMQKAEGKSPGMIGWAGRQIEKAKEGVSGTLAYTLQKMQKFSGEAAGLPGGFQGSRTGAVISQMLSSSPEDQAVDHYVLYHNDPEYKRLYDEALGMTTNE